MLDSLGRKSLSFLGRLDWLLIFCLIVGIALRIFQFPNIPPGLYVDEAGAGYESFSLLRTGADRWGIHLPVYVISWGSGQSVLYSYLSIPIIAAFGLSIFSTRLLSLVIGILTLPLLYVSVRDWLGRRAALVALILLAVMPWHVMISRWGLDANLLPFFLLLGIYTVSRALTNATSSFWVVFALVPWASSLYAYAMSYIVVPVLLALVLLFYRRVIVSNRIWYIALGLFALMACPIGLFLFKNFVAQNTLPFESYLPFGIPLLPISRLAQVASPWEARMAINLNFILTGFQDGEIRNMVIGDMPTFSILFPLVLVGAVALWREFRQSGKVNLFWLWLVACLPLFFPANLAINRINAIFIPMLVVAVAGLQKLNAMLRPSSARVLRVGVTALVLVQASIFVFDYFVSYPSEPDAELAFFKGFDRAMSKGLSIAEPTEKILVTNRIDLPYFLVAFFASYPPGQYQHEIRYTEENGAINVESFGRFYFGIDNLPDPQQPFTYVLAKWDSIPCANAQSFFETRLWQVGKCD